MSASALPTIHRVSDARPYTWGEAMRAWTPDAVKVLQQTAAHYHNTLTFSDLAERVQLDSGVATSEPAEAWVERLLTHVAKAVTAQDDVPLLALLVDDDGRVGRGYRQLAAPSAFVADRDVEQNAAAHRLLCYQKYASDLPVTGGVPGPLPKPLSRSRAVNPANKSTAAQRRPATASRATAGGAARPLTRPPAAPKRRKAEDEPAVICESCFMQLPANGVCDNCG